MADVSVRPARESEAAELARIQRDTLLMAYEGLLPVPTFAQLADPGVQSEIVASIAGQISAGGVAARVLVALEGERPVGLAFALAAVRGPAGVLVDTDPEPDRIGYLEQILVEPRWGRRGHGSRLLAAVAAFFTEAGFDRAVTWAPEQNSATLDFLVSAGWARDGYVRGLDAGAGVTLREVRLHTAL